MVLDQIGVASRAMAECALAMQLAGERAVTAAEQYEKLADECDSCGLPSDVYRQIASVFRGIEAQNATFGFQDLIAMCLNLAEVCE